MQGSFRDRVAYYMAQSLADNGADSSGYDVDSGRQRFFGQDGRLDQWRDQRHAIHDARQRGRQSVQDIRGGGGQYAAMERAEALDPTLAAAINQRGSLPNASDMARSDNRAVAAIPDGYTDPTFLTIIPDQTLATTVSLSVTTPPPSTFFAAYLLLSVSAGAQALFSISVITIGGVPMVQGAGAFGGDALNPASFNVPPVRRIIATSQPITITATNNDASTRRVSAYFFGFLARTTLQNY